MNMKKILSLLMAVAMVLSLVVVPAYATEERALKLADKDGNTTITAEAGSKVEVYLSTVGTWGFNAIGGYVTYPDGWTVKSSNQVNKLLVLEEIEAEATFTNYDGANPVSLLWTTMGVEEDDGTKLLEIGGTLAKLTFTIPAEATPGTYDITIDTVNGNPNVAFAHDANGVITSFDVADATILDVAAINCQIVIPAAPAAPYECPEHGAVTWTEVSTLSGALTSGHYKLTANIATTAAMTVAEGENVCIDLAGFNITAGAKAASKSTSYRVFTNLGSLTILDSTASGEGENYKAGIISGGALKEQGNGGDHSTLATCGGNIYNAGTFTLVDGIIANGYLNGGAYDSSDKGGNIFSENGTLNIKGGWIKDGQNNRTSQNGTETAYTGGGNISAINSTVSITGGMITGGLVSGSYAYSSTTQRKSWLYGGNMMIKGGSLSIANALIDNGVINYTLTSKKSTVVNYAYGGNIFLTGVGDVNITNSTISNGQAKAYSTGSSSCAVVAQGGNIYMDLNALAAKLTIDKDSVVTGGIAEGTSGSHAEAATAVASPSLNYRGGNIYHEDGTLEIYGKITNGSGQRGGGVFTPGGTVINMYEGSEVSGNTSTAEYGHEITITANSGILNIYGGTIRTARNDNGAALYALYSVVNMYGGLIESTGTARAINTYYSSEYKPTAINMEGGMVKGKVRLDGTTEWNVTGGTIAPTLQGDGTLTIGAGVTAYINPEAYLADCAAYKATKDAEAKACYVTYATLTDALADAAATDTVVLAADAVVEGDVDIYCALELNGKNLTATGVIDASNKDASITDSVGTSTATGSEFYAHAKNGMLAVDAANDNNVTFETVSARQKFEQNGEAVRIKFVIDDAADDTKLDEAILAGSNVKVRITVYSAALNDGFHTFAYQQSMVETYAAAWGTKMFYCDISGLEDLGEYTVVAEIVSEGIVLEAVTVA